MGAAALAGVTEMVDQDVALQWHLTGNCYPPLTDPRDFVMAQRAIELGNAEQWDEPVEVEIDGKQVFMHNTSRGHKVIARELIAAWHLESFLKFDEEEG